VRASDALFLGKGHFFGTQVFRGLEFKAVAIVGCDVGLMPLRTVLDAHRFRHTLATRLMEQGTTFEQVADILGNSPDVVRKHYGKWSKGRQANIDRLMFAHFETAAVTIPVTKMSHENMGPVN